MANFLEIDEARKTLLLGEEATLKEINSAYRRMAHRYHPDKHSDNENTENDTMKKMNWAYNLLTNYCKDYKYSFREEDISRTYPHDEYLRRYTYGWFDGI